MVRVDTGIDDASLDACSAHPEARARRINAEVRAGGVELDRDGKILLDSEHPRLAELAP